MAAGRRAVVANDGLTDRTREAPNQGQQPSSSITHYVAGRSLAVSGSYYMLEYLFVKPEMLLLEDFFSGWIASPRANDGGDGRAQAAFVSWSVRRLARRNVSARESP